MSTHHDDMSMNLLTSQSESKDGVNLLRNAFAIHTVHATCLIMIISIVAGSLKW